MEAVGIGDLHTDGTLSNLIKDFNEQIIAEVEAGPIKFARKNGITNLFFYGDTGHHARMSYEAHEAVLEMIQRNDDLMFHFILGNHDMYGDTPDAGHSMQLLKRLEKSQRNLKVYVKPRTVQIDGAAVRFLPFPHKSFDVKALNVAHLPVAGSKSDSGRKMHGDDLPTTKAVCVMGDLHTAHQVRNTYYSGTLYQTNFGESPKKYFHHIRFKNAQDYEIELIPHRPKYRLHTIIVESADDLKKAPRSSTDLLKLVISDGADVDPSMWADMYVVKTNSYRTKEELTSVLAEDLGEGEALRIRVLDFLNVWLDQKSIPVERQKRLRSLRKRILVPR